ncbi:MAG: hypothetical protein WBV46_16020 [Terriglobales bacterium]|jgi:hypothetical protein
MKTRTTTEIASVGMKPLAWIACGVLLTGAFLAPTTARGADSAAAKPYALIFGTVFDAEGHQLFAVMVKIRRASDKENKARWELYSNHTGEFAQRVPVGPADYVVWADVKGYKAADGRHLRAGEEVKVHVDGDERQDISLHLAWQ